MPDWLTPVLTVAGVALTVLGGVLGYIITAKTARRTASIQAAATAAAVEKTDAQALIDQLQEELSTHRAAADRRATAQDERMNRIERQSDGYRDYAHKLRSHIFDGSPPPPPEWPEGLPR